MSACACHWSANSSPCGWALVGVVVFMWLFVLLPWVFRP